MNGKNNKNGKLVIEGNAFYELDMQCLNQKKRQKNNACQESKDHNKTIRRPGL